MEIVLIVTPAAMVGGEIGPRLADARKRLAASKILYPRAPGAKNHTRLAMSHLDRDHRTQLRSARGYASEDGPDVLRAVMLFELEQEIRALRPAKLVLCDAHILGTLTSASEIERLHGTLTNLSRNIRVLLHLNEPARVLARYYADQIWQGRTAPLETELQLARGGNWYSDAARLHEKLRTAAGPEDEVNLPPIWLDYDAVVRTWESVFGYRALEVIPAATPAEASGSLAGRLGVDLAMITSKSEGEPPAAAWLARARQINQIFAQLQRNGETIDRKAYVSAHKLAEVDGPPIEPGSIAAIPRAMALGHESLIARVPDLAAVLTPPAALPDWTEAPAGDGFRATQYVAAVMGELDKRTAESVRKLAEQPVDQHASDPEIVETVPS